MVPSLPPDRIPPGDPRYGAVIDRRFNKRFTAAPDYVRVVRSTDDVVAAVAEAVREGRRLAVTGGGHCLEGFVSDPEVKVIIDVSPMKRIAFDRQRAAVVVEAGATVGETFQALAETWGVVVPLGEYPAIGTGGHVAGGAFGFLCRQLGLAADYLHAVEVVTVNAAGQPEVVIATRAPSDPNHDLWWGLTGAGGGNFGIVTRQWFRSAMRRMHRAPPIRRRSCRPRQVRSPPSGPSGAGPISIERPSCASAATTVPGASGPPARRRLMRRSSP